MMWVEFGDCQVEKKRREERSRRDMVRQTGRSAKTKRIW